MDIKQQIDKLYRSWKTCVKWIFQSREDNIPHENPSVTELPVKERYIHRLKNHERKNEIEKEIGLFALAIMQKLLLVEFIKNNPTPNQTFRFTYWSLNDYDTMDANADNYHELDRMMKEHPNTFKENPELERIWKMCKYLLRYGW